MEQGEVLALRLEVERLEVIGSVFYRFLLMELTPPEEVKGNWRVFYGFGGGCLFIFQRLGQRAATFISIRNTQ